MLPKGSGEFRAPLDTVRPVQLALSGGAAAAGAAPTVEAPTIRAVASVAVLSFDVHLFKFPPRCWDTMSPNLEPMAVHENRNRGERRDVTMHELGRSASAEHP